MYKKVKSLVFPYLFFSIPLFLMKSLYEVIKTGNLSQVSFFYPDTYLLGTEWFLIVLFICMIEYLLINAIKNRMSKYLVIILLFAMCYYASARNLVSFDSYLTMAGISLPFMYIGSTYKTIQSILRKFRWLFISVSLFIIISLAMYGVQINIPTLSVPYNVLIYLLASIAGIVFLISVGNILIVGAEKLRWLQIIIRPLSILGYYSLFVFVLHWIFIKTFYYSIIMPKFPGDIASVVCAITFASVTAVMGKCLKRIRFVFQ